VNGAILRSEEEDPWELLPELSAAATEDGLKKRGKVFFMFSSVALTFRLTAAVTYYAERYICACGEKGVRIRAKLDRLIHPSRV
jgi:hypothetical protein